MHTMNFYTNMAPAQELDDWFEHWATKGVKPLFTCEYMVPCTWDWTMYRGWYKGVRNFGSAQVPWEFCVAEWSSQFLGDRAYRISEAEKTNLRWEAEQFRKRPALASLGLPLPGRLARVRQPARDHRRVPRGELAGLPHLGRLGDFPLGAQLLLEPPQGSRQGPQAASRSTGRAFSARGSARTTSTGSTNAWTWPSSTPIGSRRPTGRPSCGTTSRCWPTLPGSRRHSPSKDHNFCPGRNGREADHHHQQLAGDGDGRLPVVAGSA